MRAPGISRPSIAINLFNKSQVPILVVGVQQSCDLENGNYAFSGGPRNQDICGYDETTRLFQKTYWQEVR